jgi:hypothetical protein
MKIRAGSIGCPEGALTTEEEPLCLDCPACAVHGIIQCLDHAKARLEVVVQHRVSVFRNRADNSHSFEPNMRRNDYVELTPHHLGRIGRNLHPGGRDTNNHGRRRSTPGQLIAKLSPGA